MAYPAIVVLSGSLKQIKSCETNKVKSDSIYFNFNFNFYFNFILNLI